MLEINDVVKCISNYKMMNIGSYGIVKRIDGDKIEVEIASKVGRMHQLTALMDIKDIVKVGKLF